MSAATRALSIPEILTSVFVHVNEETFWSAANVSLAWWGASQHAAYLTRERVWSAPDDYVLDLMDGLVYGPPSVGLAVRHVHLSTGISKDNGDHPDSQPLNRFAGYIISTNLNACPNITSATIYGLDYGEAASEVLHLIKSTDRHPGIDWLNLVGSDVELSEIGTDLDLAGLRHLHLTGIPSNHYVDFSYRHSLSGFGLRPDGFEYYPPSLHLSSLTLTNVGLRTEDDFGRFARGSPDGGLTAEGITWLLHAASGGSPEQKHKTTSWAAEQDEGQGWTGLRELRYRLDDKPASAATRLSGEAIAAIAQGAPKLEVCELWLKPENVADDLDQVLELLEVPTLARLELGVVVGAPKYGQRENGRKEELLGEVAAAVMALSEGQRRKVRLLD